LVNNRNMQKTRACKILLACARKYHHSKYLTTPLVSPPAVCMICGGFTGEIPLPSIAKMMPMSASSVNDPPPACSRLVVASHLFALTLPPVLSSTPPPLDALPPYITLATLPPVRLSFAPTGCRLASCGTSASHPQLALPSASASCRVSFLSAPASCCVFSCQPATL
jgi:hypothetical protein